MVLGRNLEWWLLSWCGIDAAKGQHVRKLFPGWFHSTIPAATTWTISEALGKGHLLVLHAPVRRSNLKLVRPPSACGSADPQSRGATSGRHA
eukprot:s1864_g2.t1